MREQMRDRWKEYYVYNFQDTSLASGSGAAFEDVVVRTDSDANFEAMKMIHVATDSRIYLKFVDDAFGRQYQNSGLDLRAVSGTRLFTSGVVDVGIHPNNFIGAILSTPLLINAASNFTAQFADFSGAANSVRLALHGAKIRPGKAPWDEKWRARVPFWYTNPETATITANGSTSFNVSINIDSHFLVQKITGTRTGAALVNIIDGSTDRAWMDRPMHFDNLVGNSQFPNVLVAPRFLSRGTVVNIQLQDLSGASNDIEMVFHGVKLY